MMQTNEELKLDRRDLETPTIELHINSQAIEVSFVKPGFLDALQLEKKTAYLLRRDKRSSSEEKIGFLKSSLFRKPILTVLTLRIFHKSVIIRTNLAVPSQEKLSEE